MATRRDVTEGALAPAGDERSRSPSVDRVLRTGLKGGALLALVALIWSVVALLVVRDDITRAQDLLERASSASSTADALESLRAAEHELAGVTAVLDQPGPGITARLPLIGRTVAAVRRTADTALVLAIGGRRVLVAVDAGPLLAEGSVNTDALLAVQQEVEALAADARAPLASLTDQPLGLVPGVVADPVREIQRDLVGLPSELDGAAAALRGLRAALGAEERKDVLLLLENNAELRGTGGLVSVFAQATADDGRIDVGAFQEVEDVADDATVARQVPAPEDFRALYGRYKADTTLWKNSNMSPDVPTSSAVLAEVAAALTGRRPETIIWLDVPAIAAVLRASGPVTLPDGSSLRAKDVVPRLLSTAYAETSAGPSGQGQRREVLRGAADAVVRRLLQNDTDLDAPRLLKELVAMSRGRHVAVWSADPRTQADLVTGGVAGDVAADGGDLSSFVVHNLGGGDDAGNKLDYYGRRQTTVRVRLTADSALVEQEFALRNTAPPRGLPPYVAGRVTPSVTNSLVMLALPADAREISFSRDGRGLPASSERQGDHAVLSDVVSIPPGIVVTWRMSYRLPLKRGVYRMSMFPQPLAVDSGVNVLITPVGGTELVARGGVELDSHELRVSGAYSEVTALDVQVRKPGWVRRWRDAVSRFWNEPVRLP